jgi:hypothetical protein
MGLGGPGDTPPHPKHATSIMTNIEKFYEDYLYDCHIANQRLTPEDWAFYGKEEHHIEIPNRDGGVLTPCNSQYLTTYQHWVAGVLQSEALQKCCFAYVPKEVLPYNIDTLRVKWCNTPSCEAREKGRETSKNLNVGFYAIPTEDRRRFGKIGGSISGPINGPAAVRNKTGIHDPANKQKSLDAGERGRQTCKINKLGIYSEENIQKRKKAIVLTTSEGVEMEYSSIREACAEHGMREQHLGRVLRGVRRSHKGFTARYL